VNIAAFATILDDEGNVLLTRRRDLDVWEAPGGGGEADESPWDTVARETREETGLTLVVERLVGVYWRPKKPALIFQFMCRIAAGAPAPSEEAAEVRYFPVDALPDLLAPVVRERIQDSLGGRVVYRTQEGPSASEFVAARYSARHDVDS
jgi:8-oxo-dGTP diphosphatase